MREQPEEGGEIPPEGSEQKAICWEHGVIHVHTQTPTTDSATRSRGDAATAAGKEAKPQNKKANRAHNPDGGFYGWSLCREGTRDFKQINEQHMLGCTETLAYICCKSEMVVHTNVSESPFNIF